MLRIYISICVHHREKFKLLNVATIATT
jgi:hypothetical protein